MQPDPFAPRPLLRRIRVRAVRAVRVRRRWCVRCGKATVLRHSHTAAFVRAKEWE